MMEKIGWILFCCVEVFAIVMLTIAIVNTFIVAFTKESEVSMEDSVKKKTGRKTLLPHPEQCPDYGSDDITYERFSGPNGEYVCNDCGWGQDVLTGEETNK